MRKVFAATVVAFLASLGLALVASPAQAAGVPLESACNTGWYVNPDETAFMPEQVTDGFKFEGKDLIHHEAPSGGIDFADMDKVAYSFDPTTAGKVVFKVETSAPYSTIVTNADGKLWSTAMTSDQIGGQGNPVEKYTDFIGKPVKTGKVEFSGTSQVETFGVGYWVEEGSTVVKSITFHGTKYDLECLKLATPVEPTYTAPTCDKAGAVKLPTTEGVTYTAERIVKDGVTVSAKVTATAQDGYVLPEKNGGWVWTYDVAPTGNCPTQEPTEEPTTPPATNDPGTGGGGTASPTPSESSVVAAPPMNNSGSELPVTGSSKSTMLYLLGGGLMLVAIGGGAVLYARRNRDEVEFTS